MLTNPIPCCPGYPASQQWSQRPTIAPQQLVQLDLSQLGVAPAGFGAGSGPSIPAPFNLAGPIFYQTRDPVGFGAPTGTRLITMSCMWWRDVVVACKRVLSLGLQVPSRACVVCYLCVWLRGLCGLQLVDMWLLLRHRIIRYMIKA
jgi:hypothetical protein